ncbi:sigma-54 interaction domain-containing protein [Clostridium drakei]|uniref:HTH-type transcriptional regulatory protein TyrR n=1 Tax=Clostridium drakei TaxID=332101 RepID=A0A2U8DKB9_9CLOT|nr:sigma 54-interacting transcriptional regulator [Clostridium drakei]AWI03169.1 transcriptional regulator [Clostridium drakei]
MEIEQLVNNILSDSCDLEMELEFVKFKLKELQDVIEEFNDGVYVTDKYGNTILVNKYWEKITGIKREEVLKRNMLSLEKDGYVSKSATLIVLKYKKSVTIEQKLKTGKKVLVSSNPILDREGNVTMVVTSVRDVIELYELEEQLEKKEEMLNSQYSSNTDKLKNQLLNFSDIIVEDENTINVLQMAKKVAKVDATVLLLGETGSGKEEIAKYIHKNSKRCNNNFIKINCGAIPEHLMESEFFGYEKGAFTGANREGKIGLFEMCNDGNLFLDEVGELPLDMQVKLLRVLQEREITRVGGTRTIKIDVRVIAATNRDLKKMVDKKLFREDLYYRLNVIPITVLPLRKRKKDIKPLAMHFLNKFNNKYNFNKSLTCAAMDYLYKYDWPGNVRELRNIIERTVIMSKGDKILRDDLTVRMLGDYNLVENNNKDKHFTLKEAVENLEEVLIETTFKKYGNVRAAAKELGIDASTLVRKRKKYRSKSNSKNSDT